MVWKLTNCYIRFLFVRLLVIFVLLFRLNLDLCASRNYDGTTVGYKFVVYQSLSCCVNVVSPFPNFHFSIMCRNLLTVSSTRTGCADECVMLSGFQV